MSQESVELGPEAVAEKVLGPLVRSGRCSTLER
jgi:hypothetical protein